MIAAKAQKGTATCVRSVEYPGDPVPECRSGQIDSSKPRQVQCTVCPENVAKTEPPRTERPNRFGVGGSASTSQFHVTPDAPSLVFGLLSDSRATLNWPRSEYPSNIVTRANPPAIE